MNLRESKKQANSEQGGVSRGSNIFLKRNEASKFSTFEDASDMVGDKVQLPSASPSACSSLALHQRRQERRFPYLSESSRPLMCCDEQTSGVNNL